uniref:A-kinase anchoring protein 7 n=1 Tax=Pelusios castaneus TaxID=367368 RepID=A0A8C8SNV1_9SAUR
MGQLCCFPFSRDEEKITRILSRSASFDITVSGTGHRDPRPPQGRQTAQAHNWSPEPCTGLTAKRQCEKNGAEPDDAELVSLSKRLVENAVLKAVQQYLEETQNKTRQTDGSPVKAEEAASGNKSENDSDNRK